MNKKSIVSLAIVLIVILLIAIISDSFAYFTGVSSSTAKTDITVTTPNVGLVGISGDENLTLNVTANMMTTANQGKYYAQKDGTASTKDTEQKYNIATIAVAGGADNLKYSCSGTVTISLLNDGINNIKDVLTEESLFANLSGDGENGVSFSQNDVTNIDLANAKSTDITKNFTVTLTKSSVGNDSKNILASVYFSNTSANQSALAGKNINVKITSTLTECNIVNS